MWNEDWYSQASAWGVEWRGGGATDEQRELNHFNTKGCVSSDRSSCSFDSGCHRLDLRLGLGARRSAETTLLPDCLCSSACAWNLGNRAVELVEELPPVPPFPPHTSFSWLRERWCLFLLACPCRRRATDFTHFYWLIWLCSCQQLRASQESGAGEGGGFRDAAGAAPLWLGAPGGSRGAEGASHLSHNKQMTTLERGELGLVTVCCWWESVWWAGQEGNVIACLLRWQGFRGADVRPDRRPIGAVQPALCVRPSSNMANICTAAAVRRDVSGLWGLCCQDGRN